MKNIHIVTLIAVAVLSAGSASAQGNQGRRGAGYGGPPQTEAERTARQEECQKANGGNCRNGGVCDGTGTGKGQRAGRGQGKGQGNGQGKGQRRGPRGGGGNCPLAN